MPTPHNWEIDDVLHGSFRCFGNKTVWMVVHRSKNFVVIRNLTTLITRRVKVLFDEESGQFFAHHRMNFIAKVPLQKIPKYYSSLYPFLKTKPPSQCPSSSASSSPVAEAFSRLALSRPSAASPANPPNQKA